MKNIYNSILAISLSAIVMVACTTTNEVIRPDQKPVIEAYLAPGQPVSLRLMTVIAYSETETVDSVSRPIDGQKIQIKASDGKVFNLTNTGNGYYTSAKTEVVKFGLGYSLDFKYNNLQISATTTIPNKPTGFKLDKTSISLTQRDFGQGRGPGGPGGFMMGGVMDDNTPIVLSWNNTTGEYYFVVQLSLDANPEPVIITPVNPNGQNDRGPGGRRVVNQPTNGSVANVQPQSFQYFGKYAIILYKVSPDYAALYRSGGTSTQNISTPPTTINNGLGIFTGVNTDTLRVDVLKK
jgi:Domain of unknown function (DUF4249)